jgi:hypothetical protein
MANTITLNSYERGSQQFQGAFSEQWRVKATITDQDAVSATDTVRFSLTIPGVVLGDMVVGITMTNDTSDGTDQAIVTGWVTAADTVAVQVNADVGQYAADDLNNAVVKILIGRPSW